MIPKELFDGPVTISIKSPDGSHYTEITAYIREISTQSTLDGADEFKMTGIIVGTPITAPDSEREMKVESPPSYTTSTYGKPTSLSIAGIEEMKRKLEKLGHDMRVTGSSAEEYAKILKEAAEAEIKLGGTTLKITERPSEFGKLYHAKWSIADSSEVEVCESLTFEEAMKIHYDEGDSE